MRLGFTRQRLLAIGVDLAGILGGTNGKRQRWVIVAELGGCGERCPLPTDYGSGERRDRELPQRGPGHSPGRKRILT